MQYINVVPAGNKMQVQKQIIIKKPFVLQIIKFEDTQCYVLEVESHKWFEKDVADALKVLKTLAADLKDFEDFLEGKIKQ